MPMSSYHGGMNTPFDSLPAPASYSLSDARAFLSKVYLWMAACLMLTAGIAWYAGQDAELLRWTMKNMWLLCIGGLGIVLVMSFAQRMLTSGALGVLLLAFAAVQGLFFGPILLYFTQESLALTFTCTAGMFGAMGIYGAFTKTNLSSLGSTLLMLLIGLIIAGIANIFWGNSTFDLICSGVGVIVFALFTAYDTQHILAVGMCADEDVRRKGAVLGALRLYLDFINLFLYLLRFLGNRDN